MMMMMNLAWQSGDPPTITGRRYTDIVWGVVKSIKAARLKRASALGGMEEDDDELVFFFITLKPRVA